MTQTVLITTSGIGQRLGDLTKYTNKSLVRVGKKPAISQIIESYPVHTKFVVTLGYFGDHVRDFLTIAYPHAHIEYVEVPKYEGPGTSLGLSMLAARGFLECPFIYHACDTLVHGPIPASDTNWIGVHRGFDTSQYASWTDREGRLQFHEKGAIDADFVHIGLVGIKDHKKFWDTIATLHHTDPENTTLNDCQTIARMIDEGSVFTTREFPTWHDIGNTASLQEARRAFGSSPDDLDKTGEATFIFEKSVIKFFSDQKIVQNRAERGRQLKGFVPDIEGNVGNFYKYVFMDGELYSHVVQPADFRNFLIWAEEKFWRNESEVDDVQFKKVCHTFYRDKTQKRVSQFFKTMNLEDTAHMINGEEVPSIADMFARVDFDYLSNGLQSRFHGDFILDNIVRTPKGYVLIDWRQDFGGLLRSGDRYYDLAKMNHNLTVNHRIINNNLFTVESKGSAITCDILRPSALVESQGVLFDFLHDRGYDAHKVRMLTSLIWLNMAPLHHHPFNLFLYYFGKLHLWRELQNN